ncbi:hypothetical protein OHA03_34435 [Streptomyces sp. NBC_00154]|nr:hypothetical protein [Streptomyces sp. NBC_00154]
MTRMYFAMRVSPDHLLAATVVASVAREHGELDALVDLSQMTVSQMTATSTAESHQQRLHWLAEQVFDWSGLPVVHVRPTSFLDGRCFDHQAISAIPRFPPEWSVTGHQSASCAPVSCWRSPVSFPARGWGSRHLPAPSRPCGAGG